MKSHQPRYAIRKYAVGVASVLVGFFARALKPKSEVEIETASTDFCLLAQWLIGTTPTCGTRTS